VKFNSKLRFKKNNEIKIRTLKSQDRIKVQTKDNMQKKYFFAFPIVIILLAIISCNNDNSSKEIAVTDTTSLEKDSVIPTNNGKVEMVISDIPFPFEILENLHSANITFDQKVMNPVNNISKYNQYNSKALNLGVYGADLAYVVTNEQFQQIGAYVKSAKKLAEELNIPVAFNQEMLDKYSKYKDNKDSLTQIVYDSYSQVDKTLKGDERVGIAALVVTGSWLEGLYISTRTFVNAEKNENNKSLYKTIGDQKESLNIVVKLLEEYKSDAYFAALINELKEITSLYDTVMNEKQLITINEKVEKLRKKIVEGL
jgi:hypothetical protein